MRRVVLITGVAGGIGRSTAAVFLRHGWFVAGIDRRDDGSSLGIDVFGQLDASLPDIDARVAELVAGLPRLDALVNNAAIHYDTWARAASADLDEVHEAFETNLFGAWRLTHAALPLLRESSDPRVVNVSSGAGQLEDMGVGYPAYRISKAGLNAITRILANEERAIAVNSICPGWVRTDMGGRGAPRSVAEGADTAVWLATADDPPSGGFYRDRKPIPW